MYTTLSMSHHNGYNTRHVTLRCTRHQACHTIMDTSQACHTSKCTTPAMSHHNGHKPGTSHFKVHYTRHVTPKRTQHQTCSTLWCTRHYACHTTMYTTLVHMTLCMSHHNVHDTSAHDTMHVTPQCTWQQCTRHYACHTTMYTTTVHTTLCMSHHNVHDTSVHDSMHVTPQCPRH